MARTPRAVKQQIEEAERLHAEVYSTGEVTPSDEDPPADPPVEEEAQPPVEEEAQPPVEPETNWKQKYLTLQGKYNAEMNSMNRTLEEQRQELASIKRTLEQREIETTAKVELATDEEKEEYGHEFTEFITRIANQAAQNNVANLTPKIEQIEGKVTETEERSKTGGVIATLDQQLEGWRQQNTDPNFLAWLGEVDPMFGQTRKTALDAAFQSGDAQRVASIFRAYRQTVQPATEQPPAAAGKVPLAQLAGPAATAPAGAPAPKPEPEIWTAAKVAKFYEDARLKRIPPEKYKAMEASLGKAMREGRVRPS